MSASPELLREFTRLTLATLAPVRSALGTYRVLAERHNAAANDLGSQVTHRAGEVESLLDQLDRIDRLPEALAFALEQLDAAPLWGVPLHWVERGWPVGLSPSPMLDSLVDARLAQPHAPDRAVVASALNTVYPTPRHAAVALRSLVFRSLPGGEQLDVDFPGHIAASDWSGLRWERLAEWLEGAPSLVLVQARSAEVELVGLLDHVALRSADGEWLAAFFAALGPQDTLRTAELIGMLGWAHALDGGEGHPSGAVHRSRAEAWSHALGHASRARTASGQWALGDDWFAAVIGHRTEGGEVPDTVALMFAAGTFRDGVARRAGQLGVTLLASRPLVDRRWGQSVLAGFDEMDIDRNAEAALLLGAAARSPRAAAALVSGGDGRGGRSAAAVLTHPGLGGDALAAAVVVLRSATLELHQERRPADVHASWQAIAAVIATVADRRGPRVRYGPEMSDLLVDLSLVAQQHVLARSRSGAGAVRVVGAPTAGPPDHHHAIEVPAQVLVDYFAVVARDDTARVRLLVETELLLRAGYLDAVTAGTDADGITRLVSRMGTVRGALLRAQLAATGDDAARLVHERRVANRQMERRWKVMTSLVGATPAGRVAEVTRTALWGIGLVGLDAELLSRLAHDVDVVVDTAREDNRQLLFDAAGESQVFVVSLVYADLHRRMAHQPPLPLDGYTSALLNELTLVAPGLDPARDSLDTIDPHDWAAVADHVTRGLNPVAELWAELDRRMDDIYPEVDVDPAASIGGS